MIDNKINMKSSSKRFKDQTEIHRHGVNDPRTVSCTLRSEDRINEGLESMGLHGAMGLYQGYIGLWGYKGLWGYIRLWGYTKAT